jgi:hypothetical protein
MLEQEMQHYKALYEIEVARGSGPSGTI